MDQIKIGRFIATRRREKALTQLELAERLGITDRAVSKWERGLAMPDSSLMLDLCHILGITVNDLLNGEVVSMQNQEQTREELLLEMVRQKEEADKKLLNLEWVIGIFSVIILLSFTFLAAYVGMEAWLRVTLIVAGFVLGLIGFSFAIRIEQSAGYYECVKCGHRYVPTYHAVLMAMHAGRTRYMKCPSCGKHSWQKKRVSKEEK